MENNTANTQNAPEKKSYVNPVLAWSLIGIELVALVAALIIVWCTAPTA